MLLLFVVFGSLNPHCGYVWLHFEWLSNFELGFKIGNRSFWGSVRPRGTLPKGGGLRPPPFARVSGAPGAAQTPKMTDFRPLQKLKIPSQRKTTYGGSGASLGGTFPAEPPTRQASGRASNKLRRENPEALGPLPGPVSNQRRYRLGRAQLLYVTQ